MRGRHPACPQDRWPGVCFFGGDSDPPRTVVQTQQTSNSPWGPQQPFLEQGFERAEDVFQGDQPQYFPNSTVVGFSPQTEQALRSTENRALGGNILNPLSQGQAANTLAGGFLGGNPFFQGAFDAQVRPAVEAYKEDVVPGINSAFGGANRSGSGLHQRSQERAADIFARNLAEQGTRAAYQNYGDERNRMQQMIGAAPGLAQQDYADPQALAGVGAARESLGQAQLGDEVNRFNFNQNLPANKLAQYMGLVGGGYGSEGISSTTQPFQPRNQFLGGLGGALGGAGLASLFSQNPLALGFGALGGGAAGAFG